MSELIPTVQIPPQTHSSLQVFDLCPRQYSAKYREKTVTFQQSYEAQFGDEVHKHLENQLKAGGAYQFPDKCHKDTGQNMREYQWIGEALLARAKAKGGYVLAERKFAIDYGRETDDYWNKSTWLRGKIDVTIIYPDLRMAEVTDLKGLPLDTKLPTPTGWTTMGEVAVGDTLFARNGARCHVWAKSAVKNLPCYKISFDDGSSVVCDEEHLWVTTDGKVLPVTRLQRKQRIPLPEPVQCDRADLPIDPYVFGLWLADGKRTSGEITKPDDDVWAAVAERGYSISHDYSERAADDKCRVHTVYGLRGKLGKLGVLGNKHIPTAYLRADIDQRKELLRGLFDGDGTANTCRRQVSYTSCDPALAAQVHELALSLGVRAALRPVKQFGFGKHVIAWNVTFSPRGFIPFVMKRKADKTAKMMEPVVDRYGRVSAPRHYRRVVRVEKVESVPTQCIAVDSEDSTYLCTDRYIPTHNTGKKKDDPLQVDLYSVSAMLDYGNVDTVKAGYIWAKLPPTKAIDKPKVYTRDDIQPILNTFELKTNDVKHAWATGNFPPKPNFLCGKWCDVLTCEFNGRRNN